MTATIELFRSLSSALDDIVPKVDHDLPLAEDIHPAIRKVAEYAIDIGRLPATLAKLEAQKASAESSVPARDEAVRQAKHAVRMLEAKLKKLGESIDRNRAALTEDDLKPTPKTSHPFLDAFVPSRVDLIESLRKEILAKEDELAKAKEALKRAEAFRKGVDTRVANLVRDIPTAKQAIADHGGRLEETVRILRKTITHLRNRQEKRDRKREERADVAVKDADIPDDEACKAASDEAIRELAESMGLSIDGLDDLEIARQLFN